MGTQRFRFKSKKVVYFVNTIDLPQRCVVFFVVCQLLRSILRDFGELSLFRYPLLKERLFLVVESLITITLVFHTMITGNFYCAFVLCVVLKSFH